MSDTTVEKSLLFLLFVSLLLHIGVFVLFLNLPHEKQAQPKEPVFIDLQDMQESKQPPPSQTKDPPRESDRRMRVEREQAPRGSDHRDRIVPRVPQSPAPQNQKAAPSQRRSVQRTPGEQPLPERPAQPSVPDRQEGGGLPGSPTAGLLKPRAQQSPPMSGQPQLFPAANRLAKLEESYRKKFENEIAEGDTRFLNSDDILFGSFLRRFENAVYGVWRYPAEAARNGIEGVTPVRITFNRDGSINYAKTRLLESSGSRILDDEVMRTLRAIGPVGAMPKGYAKDEFHLIAFFQYGGARRSLR